MSTSPTGPVVLVEKDQIPRMLKRGAIFLRNDTLKTKDRRCTFQKPEGFCGLHGTNAKPRSCIISPFKLTSRDTLIVKNRYRLLICFKAAPALPAYKAFASSLVLLFGKREAERLTEHFDKGGGNTVGMMLRERYEFMKRTDDNWHGRKQSRQRGA